MNYTVHCDADINRKINDDLKIIVERVTELLGEHIHSILLYGGFGRGEGSIKIENIGISIVNDYDISVVLNESNRFKYMTLYKKYNKLLQNLAEKLADDLQIKQIDLGLKTISYFKGTTPPKIVDYELRNGYQLLYGKEDPCQRLPCFKSEDIPLSEGTRLFRNRGGGLIIAAKYFTDYSKVHFEKKENFIIETNKALIAIGDSILLLKKKYHYLYSKRRELIKHIDISDIPSSEKIKAEYLKAVSQKLRPDFKQYDDIDLKKWWFESQRLFEEFFLYFESLRLDTQIKDWLQYRVLSKPEDNIDIRVLLGNILRNGIGAIRHGLVKAQTGKFTSLMALLLFSIGENRFRDEYLANAGGIMGFALKGESLEDWKELTDMFLYLWHPAGEVGKVIEKK